MTDFRSGSRQPSNEVDVMVGDIKYGELQCSPPTVSMASEINQKDSGIKYSSNIKTTGYIWQRGKQTGEIMDWGKYNFRISLIENGEKNSLGIYIPQTVQKETDNGSTLYEVTGYDKSVLVKNDCILTRNFIAAGTKYLDAISALLISSGITQIIADESDAVFATDRDDWEIGTSKLKIVNQLLGEISFRSLEIDRNGSANLRVYQDASSENIQHIYREGKASIVSPNTTISSNQLDIPNVWIATVSNPDLPAPLTYKYVNDNPLSQTSTVYTGQNKVKVLSFDNVATQADLESAVKKQAFNDMLGIETVQFKTAAVADHGVNDTVVLELPEFHGILTETEWEINCEDYTMSHTGKKLMYE